MSDDTNLALTVAHASGQKPGDTRWTELTITRPCPTQFVAEIIGATTVPGEERRERRHAFPTLAKALNWGSFDQKTKLYDELRQKAIAWMEAQARDVTAGGNGSGLVPVRFGGHTSPETPLPAELAGKAGSFQVDMPQFHIEKAGPVLREGGHYEGVLEFRDGVPQLTSLKFVDQVPAPGKRYARVEVVLHYPREQPPEPNSVSVTWFNEDGSIGARTSGRFQPSFPGATISCELPENVR